MKSVIVIPARYASTRLPGKPLQLINGVSMLARTVGAARQAGARIKIKFAMQFDDFIAGVQVGPEFTSGRDKIALSAGPAWRWYGTDPYSFTASGSASWQHPTGKRSQKFRSAPPASIRRTRTEGSADKRLASTQPADPAPTTM